MLCHHVLGHGYRNPALPAKMASTLQVLSGGRFMLGIGAGWREDEYRSYGYDVPKASLRLSQREEVVQMRRLMWAEEPPTFNGTYFQIDDAAATPRPDLVSPICIRSSSEQIGLRIVGRQADIRTGAYLDDAVWRRKRDIVNAAAVDAGRNPSAFESSVTVVGDPPFGLRVAAVAGAARASRQSRCDALRDGLRAPRSSRARASLSRSSLL
jgi:alkanesulfonate monooxygenase SsuD/methylene tetrahydromethanopterin reductase-like flavin-dependent oxidoreductase (luciferase family)